MNLKKNDLTTEVFSGILLVLVKKSEFIHPLFNLWDGDSTSHIQQFLQSNQYGDLWKFSFPIDIICYSMHITTNWLDVTIYVKINLLFEILIWL